MKAVATGVGVVVFLEPQSSTAETIEIRKAEPVVQRNAKSRPSPPVEASRVAAPVEAVLVPADPVAVKTVDEKPMLASLTKVPLEPSLSPDFKPLEDKMQRLPVEPTEAVYEPLLFVAAVNNDGAKISRLIADGANPNAKNPEGDTPLCAAVRQGAEASVEALLEGGANVSQAGLEKQPPLALASLRRGPGIIRSLLAAGADPNTRFVSPVPKEVIERAMIKDLKGALENDRGVTALIACTSRGDVEGASELMRAGAKANICTTRYKRYPINFAATQGYLFLMRIILGRQPESEPE
ncbi:MAG TPA: ankyrin repeat domain-containing protein, partial [Prosthecobacter sp.]|nr:ankyrin repeat domain-containing protein [Prosthecobacter sp.]